MTLILERATLVKRYNRFLADVQKEKDILTVHCPNSGSMKGLSTSGNHVWISMSQNPNRKLKHTLEIIEVDGTLVGVNTHRTNQIVKEALEKKEIPNLGSYDEIHPEISYGSNSRIDFGLKTNNVLHTYIEVKNVTLKDGDYALFPDAPTERGTKHILNLMEAKYKGYRAIMFYVIQRSDCKKFSIANMIDPLYGETLKKAVEKGVEVMAYQCHVTPTQIQLGNSIIIDLDF
ncbi:MAG: DNA/RNA nuclease SfsA [Alphaproteobacteria bacterium]